MKIMLILLAGFWFAVGAGRAGEPGKLPPQTLHAADQNRDGQVDADEWWAHLKKASFTELDEDRDQAIALEEWKKIHADEGAEARFKALDSNRDGKISYLEYEAFMESQRREYLASFKRLDADGSGFLTRDELSSGPQSTFFKINF